MERMKSPASTWPSVIAAVLISQAALGSVAGYFIAISLSPILTTLIPILFGTLGGGLWVLIGRARTGWQHQQLVLLSAAVTVFCLALIISHTVSIGVRDKSISYFVTKDRLDRLSAQDQFTLVAFRKLLQRLGASPAEQGAALELAYQRSVADGNLQPSDKLIAGLARVVSNMRSLADFVKPPLERPERAPNEHSFGFSSAHAVLSYIDSMPERIAVYERGIAALKEGKAISGKLLELSINRQLRAIESLVRDDENNVMDEIYIYAKKSGSVVALAGRELYDSLLELRTFVPGSSLDSIRTEFLRDDTLSTLLGEKQIERPVGHEALE